VTVDCAPLLIGGKTAPGPLGGEGFLSLGLAARVEHLEVRRRGSDVVLTGYRQGLIGDLLGKVKSA
jgi:diaminohydroxyphosphoribosylaminopyrimidine deaminase/5-amino-6-(5-phosphoribosylamino)uracil reductase